MNSQKGFIQIPILIAIIVGLFVVGGAGYVGVKQYQSQQIEKTKAENLQEEVASHDKQATSTGELSEVDKLKQEIESLKKEQAEDKRESAKLTPTQNTSPTLPKPLPPPPIVQQPTSTVADSLDYKQHALTVLNEARRNYVRLQSFSKEATSFLSERKDVLKQTADSTTILLPKISDPQLYELFDLLRQYDLNETIILTEKQTFFEITLPNFIQNEIIKKIDDNIALVQTPGRKVPYDELMFYQMTFFGTNKIQNDEASIKAAVDKLKNQLAGYDDVRLKSLAAVETYIDNNSVSSVSYPTSYVPPLYTFPQMPQTTRCTISGDGGVGLQAYVNCTASSF